MKLLLHTDGYYDAAHHLEEYKGVCKNLHGHTYKVDVWIQGDSEWLDKAGILFDFSNVKLLTKQLDHNGDINRILSGNSTAERQSIWFYKKLKEMNSKLLFRVRVYEQLHPKESWCECGDDFL